MRNFIYIVLIFLMCPLALEVYRKGYNNGFKYANFLTEPAQNELIITNKIIRSIWTKDGPSSVIDFIKTAEKAIQEQEPDIVKCVENLKQYGGFAGEGDYSSYKHCSVLKYKNIAPKKSGEIMKEIEKIMKSHTYKYYDNGGEEHEGVSETKLAEAIEQYVIKARVKELDKQYSLIKQVKSQSAMDIFIEGMAERIEELKKGE